MLARLVPCGAIFRSAGVMKFLLLANVTKDLTKSHKVVDKELGKTQIQKQIYHVNAKMVWVQGDILFYTCAY